MALNINKENWQNTKVANEGTGKIKPGVFILKIVAVRDFGNYLQFYLDYADGNYMANAMTKITGGNLDGWWNVLTKRSYYGDGNNARFKGDITAIEKSNNNYSFEETGFEEQTLVGKLVVGVIYEDEYRAKDGSVKVSLKLDNFRSLEAYREGLVQPKERDTLAMKEERLRKAEEEKAKGYKQTFEPNQNGTPFTTPYTANPYVAQNNTFNPNVSYNPTPNQTYSPKPTYNPNGKTTPKNNPFGNNLVDDEDLPF